MIELFVPGRLCLFGEHTDWAGKYRTMNADIAPGASIVTGIEQGIYAEVEKYRDFFETPLSEDHLHKLSPEMQEYENRILSIGKKLHLFIKRRNVALDMQFIRLQILLTMSLFYFF